MNKSDVTVTGFFETSAKCITKLAFAKNRNEKKQMLRYRMMYRYHNNNIITIITARYAVESQLNINLLTVCGMPTCASSLDGHGC